MLCAVVSELFKVMKPKKTPFGVFNSIGISLKKI